MRLLRFKFGLLAVLAALAALVLVAGGCGQRTGSIDTSAIRIQPRSNGASVSFEAPEAGFCLVAIGTSPGNYTRTIPESMPEGPHRDHLNQITGLQPDTTYYVRVASMSESGVLRQSRELTFRTAPAASSAQPPASESGRNVALSANGGRILSVSSNYGGGGNESTWGALSAIDGDPNTAWSSNGDGNGAWIEIGFDRAYTVDRVGFWTRTMGTSAEIQQIRVVLPDGSALGPFVIQGPKAITMIELPMPVTTDRMRFEVVASNGGNTGAVEIEVYEKQGN